MQYSSFLGVKEKNKNMKILKLSLSLLFLGTIFVNAQKFGVKGGLNISNLSKGFDYEDTKSKAGLYGGVFAEIPISTQFSFQPEVLYNMMGSKIIYPANPIGNNIDVTLNYISVPLTIKYKPVPKVYLEAGPHFSFLISSKQKYKTLNGSEIKTNLPKEFLNTLDVAVGIGAGYYFLENLGVSARYVTGFTDIYKNNDQDAVNNSNFQIGLMYNFK